MPTTGDDGARDERLRRLAQEILSRVDSSDTPETAQELSDRSTRTHRAIRSGAFGREPTELRVRLHGSGVVGFQVPADQVGDVLRHTQLLVRWIGSRLQTLGKSDGLSRLDTRGPKDATRLFVQPQLGAGSLVFTLVGAEAPVSTDDGQMSIAEPRPESLLDRALEQLLMIVASSEEDSPGALGDLSRYVSQMGPRVASQLRKLASHVTEDDIDIELRMMAAGGKLRHRANLSRRGALAITDAVERNSVQTRNVVMQGLLETVSTGKDLVRLEGGDGTIRMKVHKDLGVRLGPLLHREVEALVERTTRWHVSGKEVHTYRLLNVTHVQIIDPDGE